MSRSFISVALLLLAACGGNQQENAPANASETPAQQGYDAAWTVAHTDHTDTIALQRAIIDARARHDRFVLMGDDEEAQAFEQAFADSLRHIDPEIATIIFGEIKP